VERREEFDQLLAPHLLAKKGLAVPVLTVKMKQMLAKIDPNQRHVLHDGPLQKEKHPTA
jgi:hypothetical protein